MTVDSFSFCGPWQDEGEHTCDLMGCYFRWIVTSLRVSIEVTQGSSTATLHLRSRRCHRKRPEGRAAIHSEQRGSSRCWKTVASTTNLVLNLGICGRTRSDIACQAVSKQYPWGSSSTLRSYGLYSCKNHRDIIFSSVILSPS